jgi:N-acetylneuraminic acid mutarotase
MGTRQLASFVLVSSLVVGGCDNFEAPSATGQITLNVLASAGACGPLHSGRVQIRGPTERTVTIAPGATDTIGDLLPGTYTVGLEGIFSGEVDCFGQSSGVQVAAGQHTTVAITLASFLTSISQFVQSPGTKSFTVNFGPVAGAASYEVEAATDSAFTANHVVQPSTQTSVVVTVPTSGPYSVQVRAIDPYQARGRPSVELFTVTCDCWTAKAAMPSTPRRELAVGVVNGVLYAVGGWNGSNLTTVEAYDPATNTWTAKAAMPTPRNGLAVGVVNGVLYAVGGFNGGYLSTVEAYDPATNTWTAKAAMPNRSQGVAVGVVNGVLYAVGGFNGSANLSTVQAYDPVSNTWTTRAAMPTARAALAVGVVNGVLYAVGGEDYAPGALTTVEAYDPVANTWTAKAAMPTERGHLAIGVVNGALYAVGGSNGGYRATVEAYDPVSNTWTSKAAMPTPRNGLAVGVVNGVLYAVGGFNGGYLSTVEAYDP